MDRERQNLEGVVVKEIKVGAMLSEPRCNCTWSRAIGVPSAGWRCGVPATL
jgi:hypothetical protein